MTSVFVDGIVKTMKSKAGPSSKELVTVADAEKFLANNEHSIVGLWTLHLISTLRFLLSLVGQTRFMLFTTWIKI